MLPWEHELLNQDRRPEKNFQNRSVFTNAEKSLDEGKKYIIEPVELCWRRFKTSFFFAKKIYIKKILSKREKRKQEISLRS